MPPKKRDKEQAEPSTTGATGAKAPARMQDQIQADHELFLQAFEKPTQIYRFLRTRNQMSADGQINGNSIEEMFSLQELYDYVKKMVRTTELAKRTLQMECEEAKFALKPWPIETTTIKQIDRNICICEEGVSSEERAEEIATEIGRALLHSQQLREKLAENLRKERQASRHPDVREIYTSALKKPLKEANTNSRYAVKERPRRSLSQHPLESKKPSKEANTNSCDVEKERPRRSLSQQCLSESRSNRSRSTSTVRPTKENVGGRKTVTSKTQIKTSKDNVLAQITGYQRPKNQTNFILANKLSAKGTKSSSTCKKVQSKSQVDLRKISGSSTKINPTTSDKSISTSVENDEIETLAELDRLIKKFAKEATLRIKHNCPIHAQNPSRVIEERIVTLVDAVDGLDRFGVPPRLVKILKTYHAYVKIEVIDANFALTKKQEGAADTFLAHFDRIGKKRHLTPEDKYLDLLREYSVLFRDFSYSTLSRHKVKTFESKFKSLESNYNECDVKNTAGKVKYARSSPDDTNNDLAVDLRNWISNGVWNYSCAPELKDIFGSHITRYSDRNQLLLFFSLVQNVQRKSYEKELIKLLLQCVIPKFKKLFDPNSQEFIDIYKMMISVTQILNPKAPVLAKTEDS